VLAVRHFRFAMGNVAEAGNAVRRMLESMSVKQGVKFDSPSSVREIAPFIAFHNLNMEEALNPVADFSTSTPSVSSFGVRR